jgi:hypothetical protein
VQCKHYDSYCTAFAFAYLHKLAAAQAALAAGAPPSQPQLKSTDGDCDSANTSHSALSAVAAIDSKKNTMPMFRSMFTLNLDPTGDDACSLPPDHELFLLSGFPHAFQTSDLYNLFQPPAPAADASDTSTTEGDGNGDGDAGAGEKKTTTAAPKVRFRWIDDTSVL